MLLPEEPSLWRWRGGCCCSRHPAPGCGGSEPWRTLRQLKHIYLRPDTFQFYKAGRWFSQLAPQDKFVQFNSQQKNKCCFKVENNQLVLLAVHCPPLQCNASSVWCFVLTWLTDKRDETLLLISGDVLHPVTGQPRPSQPLTKLTAMMFPPELSEPGVPTVHLRGCWET